LDKPQINENIYKKNLLILETQTERIEQDRPQLESLNTYLDSWVGACRQITTHVPCQVWCRKNEFAGGEEDRVK
jgi:hypothetical protein